MILSQNNHGFWTLAYILFINSAHSVRNFVNSYQAEIEWAIEKCTPKFRVRSANFLNFALVTFPP